MPRNDNSLNIATFNLRYDNPGDGPNAWPNRREWVRDLIDYHEFDLFGIQEGLIHQVEYLTEGRFGYVGVGRDDGKRGGEFSAILYDKKRFEVAKNGTFWLSETPDTCSKGWDADCFRVCTWARLKDRATGKTFYHFNTHFDHKGVVARERSAELLLKRVPEIAGREPFFLTGDFNMTPDHPALRRIAAALKDSQTLSKQKPYGPFGTANGFDMSRPLDTHIDYIFVSPRIDVFKYAVLPDNWNQRYPSDHLPVVIRAEVK